MHNSKWLMLLLIMIGVPASAAINVSFEKIARTGDPVPGRETLPVVFNGRAFQRFGPGVFSRPTINDVGQVLFMARSTVATNFNQLSTIGLYLKSPGMPLKLIFDQSDNNAFNTASTGAPFAVPGRPSDARFLGSVSEVPPLLNNRGDILFLESSSSPTEGTAVGIYAVRASDGVMIKIVDSLDEVPGLPGQTFNVGFSFFRNETLPVSMNDLGQIVFLGRFRQPGAQFEDQGLYGVSIDGRPVAGGPIVRLADTTQTVFPANETVPFRGFSFSNQPAINNNGIVIFQAGIGNPPPSILLDGIFTIPVDGSAGATTIARRGQVSPPLSDGTARAWFSIFGGHDINDAGQFLFQHAFGASFGSTNGLFAGTLGGATISLVADSAGGFAVPGQPAGTNFTGQAFASINESGQLGFYAGDTGPISNAHGIYAADLAGTPFEVIGHNEDVPPGRVPPAKITTFRNRSAVVNDLGNIATAGEGVDLSMSPPTVFGLYFFDGCTRTLERVVDDQTSAPAPPAGLGGQWGSTGERALRIYDGKEARSGHYRSFNNSDEIAFFAAFSTFDVGVYIARVQTGGGGDLRIVCPKDLTLECPVADTSSAATGEPRVCSDNPVAVTSNDATLPGCGTTTIITRAWTADDGITQVSCNQVIEVVDTTDPVLVGVPADAAVDCTAVPPPANPTVTDDCDAGATISLTEIQTPGSCAGEFMLTRTWTATDACGNSTTRSQILTVGNTTAPVLTIPPDVTIDCNADSSPAGTGAANATTGCAGAPTITFADSVVAGTCGSDTVITRTWTATDVCGNSASGDQTITVSDATPPVITVPADVTIQCDADSSPAGTGTATAVDACLGAVVVDFTDELTVSDLCGAGSRITRTWTATDSCNNIATAKQIITVVDTTPPALTVPPDAAIECDADSSATAAGTGLATALDGCDNAPVVSFSDAAAAGNCAGQSIITRTWTATDACGNSSSADQTITLTDSTAPVLTVPADMTIECSADSSPAGTGSATATDGCDAAPAVSFSDAVAAGSCADQSVITRTWTAADSCGNAATPEGQIITVVDTTAPDLTCPADIAVSGGFGGRTVSFSPSATDLCDASPSVMATPMSGSFFPTGVTPVSATATDACANTSLVCSFDVLVSCFGVNRAKIGTKDQVCRGIESIEFTSMNGTEELISLFKAEEGSGGGVEEDTLPASIIVDDGVNGPVTVDTSCGVAIQVGDVYGPYTVSDIDQDFDDQPENRGNDVQVRGTFVPAIPFDLAVDDFDISIDDGQGNVASFTIPAGSFVSDGNPAKGKFKFEGNVGTADVKVKLKGCKVKFKAKNATNTAALTGTAVTIRLTVGPNTGEDLLVMEDKGNHLKFKRQPKVNCCPSCNGVASMQVTSDQGVLVFVPDSGKTKLNSNTVVDDGVNGPVTIHTSCSQPISVGDTFGAYTISELIKIFDGS